MSKTKKVIYYVLTGIVTALFLFSAYSKLTADPQQVAGFQVAHLPIWFMYFIGTAELLGAIGLWIPKLQKWAVYGLEIIMIGAVVTTVIFVNIPMAILPLIVGLILYFITLKWGAAMRNSEPAVSPTPTPSV